MRAMGRRGGGSARARAVVAAATLGAAVLVAGCSTSHAAAGASGRCTAAPGVSPSEVNFGLLYPATANSAGFSPYRAGVDARLGVANAKGGVYGRKVAYTWADDDGRAETNLAGAQRLVTTDKVFSVEEISPAPIGSAQWLNAQGVPVVGTSNDLVWTQYRNMISYSNLVTNSRSVTTWGDYEKRQGVKRAAILYSPLTDGSRLVGNAFQASFEADHIPTVMIQAESASLDIPALVQQIKNSGADLVTGILDTDAFIQVALQARQQIPNIGILSVIGYDQRLLSAVGRQLAGMSLFVGFVPFESHTPAERVFLTAMAQYAPQQQPPANGLAMSGWADTDLLVRGLQAAGPCPTRRNFLTNLRAVTSYNAGGLLAKPVDLSKNFGELNPCYAFLKVAANGAQFVPFGTVCGRQLQG